MQRWLGPIFLSLAAAIWGGQYVVSKVVLTFIPPWILLEIRFLISLVVLGIWVWVIGKWKVYAQDLKWLALIGLVGYTGSIGFQFIGTHLSGAAMGSLITSSSPALISLFAWMILKEKMNLKKMAAVFVATIGVLIVVDLTQISNVSTSFIGNMILVGAAVTWAIYTVLSRVQTMKYDSLTVTFWANLFGVLFTTPIAWWEWNRTSFELPTDLLIWLGIIYIGIISTALAFYFWNKGFEYIDAATGSLFFFVQPVVGSLFGAWLLGEKLSIHFYIGALFIGLGIFLSTLQTKKGSENSLTH